MHRSETTVTIVTFLSNRKFLDFLIAKSLSIGVHRSETTVTIVTFLSNRKFLNFLLAKKLTLRQRRSFVKSFFIKMNRTDTDNITFPRYLHIDKFKLCNIKQSAVGNAYFRYDGQRKKCKRQKRVNLFRYGKLFCGFIQVIVCGDNLFRTVL